MVFQSFAEFYPFYLQEHSNKFCRYCHYCGSTLVLITLVVALVSRNMRLLWLLPVFGYGFAWLGHFVFEKNKPATFTHPIYSFLGDWVMYGNWLLSPIKGRARP